MSVTAELDEARLRSKGLLLVVLVAVAAKFVSEHYGAPAMLFALLIGMAFNFLADDERFAPGVDFASRTLLRIGVALLGFRLGLADIAALGPGRVLSVVVLVAATILVGILLAPLLGRRWSFGLLTGGSVAICGASAALAISAVLPRREDSERDVLFTVVAVTTLSTCAMVVYPILFRTLGLSEVQSGFLVGATIHDVAQVVGAGYSVSDKAGDLATLVKLGRVVLLPLVLLAIVLTTGRKGGSGLGVPAFVLAFVVFASLNSVGIVPGVVHDGAVLASQWLLIVAIAALGVKTSLKVMLNLGPTYIAVIVAETLFLLVAALVVASLGI